MSLNRRQILGLGAVAAILGTGAYGLLRSFSQQLEFEPLADVPGFRRIKTGAMSVRSRSGRDPLIGLNTRENAETPQKISDLETALFEPPRNDGVRIASFSDYACPHCRPLSLLLSDLQAAGDISVTWHELPLLGPGSVTGAKAALAARAQGRYLDMHNRLMKSQFRINSAYIEAISEDMTLNTPRLLADMKGPDVAAQLSQSAALARMFGIPGTPALVVGKTLVLGAISRAQLRRLIKQERII